jgi:hypothetical protein
MAVMTTDRTEEQAAAEVAAANAASILIGWSPCRATCPHCGLRGTAEVRQCYRVQPPGSFSLAGVQVKFPARLGWEFRCGICGVSGSAAPK